MRLICETLRTVALFVFAIGLLAGCGTVERPFGKGSELATAREAPDISIPPVTGLPAAKSASLAGYLVAAAERHGLTAESTTGRADGYRLAGRIAAGPGAEATTVSYAWDLVAPDGKVIHSITGDRRVPGKTPADPLAAVDEEVLFAIAGQTADRLADYVGGQGFAVRSTVAPPSVADTSEPEITVGSVSGPGAGGAAPPVVVSRFSGIDNTSSRAMTAAMSRALARAGIPIAERGGPTVIKVAGRAAVGLPSRGQQPVSIVWQVLDARNELVGTVKQDNNVPAGTLDEGWSPIAQMVAEAAAGGVVELIRKVR